MLVVTREIKVLGMGKFFIHPMRVAKNRKMHKCVGFQNKPQACDTTAEFVTENKYFVSQEVT